MINDSIYINNLKRYNHDNIVNTENITFKKKTLNDVKDIVIPNIISHNLKSKILLKPDIPILTEPKKKENQQKDITKIIKTLSIIANKNNSIIKENGCIANVAINKKCDTGTYGKISGIRDNKKERSYFYIMLLMNDLISSSKIMEIEQQGKILSVLRQENIVDDHKTRIYGYVQKAFNFICEISPLIEDITSFLLLGSPGIVLAAIDAVDEIDKLATGKSFINDIEKELYDKILNPFIKIINNTILDALTHFGIKENQARIIAKDLSEIITVAFFISSLKLIKCDIFSDNENMIKLLSSLIKVIEKRFDLGKNISELTNMTASALLKEGEQYAGKLFPELGKEISKSFEGLLPPDLLKKLESDISAAIADVSGPMTAALSDFVSSVTNTVSKVISGQGLDTPALKNALAIFESRMVAELRSTVNKLLSSSAADLLKEGEQYAGKLFSELGKEISKSFKGLLPPDLLKKLESDISAAIADVSGPMTAALSDFVSSVTNTVSKVISGQGLDTPALKNALAIFESRMVAELRSTVNKLLSSSAADLLKEGEQYAGKLFSELGKEISKSFEGLLPPDLLKKLESDISAAIADVSGPMTAALSDFVSSVTNTVSKVISGQGLDTPALKNALAIFESRMVAELRSTVNKLLSSSAADLLKEGEQYAGKLFSELGKEISKSFEGLLPPDLLKKLESDISAAIADVSGPMTAALSDFVSSVTNTVSKVISGQGLDTPALKNALAIFESRMVAELRSTVNKLLSSSAADLLKEGEQYAGKLFSELGKEISKSFEGLLPPDLLKKLESDISAAIADVSGPMTAALSDFVSSVTNTVSKVISGQGLDTPALKNALAIFESRMVAELRSTVNKLLSSSAADLLKEGEQYAGKLFSELGKEISKSFEGLLPPDLLKKLESDISAAIVDVSGPMTAALSDFVSSVTNTVSKVISGQGLDTPALKNALARFESRMVAELRSTVNKLLSSSAADLLKEGEQYAGKLFPELGKEISKSFGGLLPPDLLKKLESDISAAIADVSGPMTAALSDFVSSVTNTVSKVISGQGLDTPALKNALARFESRMVAELRSTVNKLLSSSAADLLKEGEQYAGKLFSELGKEISKSFEGLLPPDLLKKLESDISAAIADVSGPMTAALSDFVSSVTNTVSKVISGQGLDTPALKNALAIFESRMVAELRSTVNKLLSSSAADLLKEGGQKDSFSISNHISFLELRPKAADNDSMQKSMTLIENYVNNKIEQKTKEINNEIIYNQTNRIISFLKKHENNNELMINKSLMLISRA